MQKIKGLIAGCICEKCGKQISFRYATKNFIREQARQAGWTVSDPKNVDSVDGKEFRVVCHCPTCRTKHGRPFNSK